MGASSAELDQAIVETRGELDSQLTALERRAASEVRKYRLVAAGLAVGVLVVAAGAVLYRRRRRTPVARLQNVVRSARRLPDRARGPLPIKILVTDRTGEERAGGTLANIAQKAAPAAVGSATGAVLARLGRRGSSDPSSG